MNWFGGSIAEAVTYSQTQKTLFFVAILGTDDASKNLERLLADPEVVSFISDTSKFVCIRLADGTEEHRQFLQLYTNAKSPSIYCITLKGVAIKIISNPADVAELRNQVEEAWTRHQEVISQLGQAPTPIASASLQATTAPLADPGMSSGAQASGQQPQPSLEERIERAKKLAAAKQQKRAAEEAEEQRNREKERREHGKGAAELKRWQEEEETKRLAEERRRDKKADALLKQKLREQIAQDRIDRQRRENPVESTTSEVVAPSSLTPTPPQPPVNFSGQARLQFRLPTGVTRNQSFDPDSTLQDVRQYLITNAVVPFRDFTISVAFPRRQFTGEDYRATLRDLGLLPSAALLILPISSESIVQKAGSAGQGLFGFLTSIFGFMLYPITLVFSFLQRSIAPAPPPPRPGDRAIERGQPSRGNLLGGRGRETTDKSAPSTSKAAKEANESAKKPKPSDHFGADGNVHRLRNGDDSDSDDEQATWNGNSTQQM